MKSSGFFLALSTIATLLLCSGCSSSRKSSGTNATLPAGMEARYAAIDSATLAWTDVNVPFSFKLSSPTEFSISGRMKMIQGHSVDISLRVLGIEMARLMVTPDSVFASYRLKKLYVAEPINVAGNAAPLLLGNLQDILMGRLFIVGQPRSDGSMLPPLKSFETEEINGMLALTAPKITHDVTYAFFIGSNNLLSTTEMIAPGAATATINYSGHRDTNAGQLPSRDILTISLEKTAIEATIDWKWSSARWNTGITSDWSDPRGYKKVSLKELLGNLSLK